MGCEKGGRRKIRGFEFEINGGGVGDERLWGGGGLEKIPKMAASVLESVLIPCPLYILLKSTLPYPIRARDVTLSGKRKMMWKKALLSPPKDFSFRANVGCCYYHNSNRMCLAHGRRTTSAGTSTNTGAL